MILHLPAKSGFFIALFGLFLFAAVGISIIKFNASAWLVYLPVVTWIFSLVVGIQVVCKPHGQKREADLSKFTIAFSLVMILVSLVCISNICVYKIMIDEHRLQKAK